MKTHFYLLRTSIKNSIKELAKKPGKLVLYLVMILGIGVGLVATLMNATQISEAIVPIAYLQAIFFAFLILFYGIAIQRGLSSGNTIFEMSDVNLLFVSPVNPRATLLYGLIRLTGTSFWAGFFILFQSNSLASFGIAYDGVLILFFLFILNTMVLTLLSLVIYSFSNGNPVRKQIVRVLAVAVFIPIAALCLTRFLSNGDFLITIKDVVSSPVFAATPIVGWTSAGAISLIEGNLLAGFGWLSLLVLSGAGMLLYIMLSRSDYYEDVLIATETAFERKRSAAEGNIQAAGSTAANVKVKANGLSGKGAQVFLYKHLRETFRQNRFGFFGLNNFIIAVCAIVSSRLYLKGNDIIMVLQILMWIQIFLIGTGRGLMETYYHYLFLIPISPFKKAVWSNLELVVKTVAESILYLGVPGLIMKSSPLIIIGSMITYILFAFLLLGVNYLFLRWTASDISQGVLMTIYFLVVLLTMVPGLIPALIVGFMIGGTTGVLIGLLIISGWELIAAFICFALSKDILHNCDIPSMQIMKKNAS